MSFGAILHPTAVIFYWGLKRKERRKQHDPNNRHHHCNPNPATKPTTSSINHNSDSLVKETAKENESGNDVNYLTATLVPYYCVQSEFLGRREEKRKRRVRRV
mmetsp:Transcript_38198/g.60457  ORF Transcript_38198/g.60457 Transcript_38198/m.60457 type:complete len:103 (+) Transcript_38198:119-427(+)